MDGEVAAYARRLVAIVDDSVGVVGAYLHGSASLGGFVPGRSDVDLLVVVDHEPDDVEGLADLLIEHSSPCPGRGVELSVVTREAAGAVTEPCPFIVHVATDSSASRVVRGATTDGDPDLLMHYAVCRAAGWAVVGPPPSEVFGLPIRDVLLAYLADELASALTGCEAYAVLNACRAWQYVETGALVSKVSGGSWAKEHGGPMLVIGRALSAQMGLLPDRAVGVDAERFVRTVIDRLVG